MDFFSKRRLGITLVVLFGLSAAAMAVDAFPPLVNWSAPATYTPARSAGARALGDITLPVPLIGITPCRQFDIRPATLADNTPMAITLTGAPCGIPASAVAVSVNITVFSIVAGANGVFKVGTVNPPTTAWINYPPTETQRGNAGSVPVNGSGQIWIEVNQGGGSIQLTVDVNGYYASVINNGEFFEQVGNVAGLPLVLGINSSNSGGITTGVGGQINGTGTDAAGVTGLAVAGTGVVHGVKGQSSSASDGASGVKGHAFSTTGQVFGVLGQTDSTAIGVSQAGVRGMDSSGYNPTDFFGPSGVLGTAQDWFGVSGKSRYIAVYGQLMTTADAHGAFGVLGSSFGVAFDATAPPWGVFAGGNLGASGAKHFVEPDPREPNGLILYSSLEGREVGTYFRGTARSSGGRAVIEIPEDFRIVTDENGLTVQLTPVGSFSQMYVESQDLNEIVVHSSRDVTFHYLVQGVRRAFKDFSPLARGYEFMPLSPDARMPQYLTEEAKRRLIANGTYNADGTVNMATAERAGWTKVWANRQAEAEAAARKAREAAPASGQSWH
jgi:hypothetical protein